MLIVADENIPLLDEFFAPVGTIRRLPGRTLSAADLVGADLLLVRSVTRVDARLLEQARPRFVGSATIGTDHVDLDWLARQDIPFSAAPGCNARAVAEYIATVLCLFSVKRGRALAGLRLGVVGCGNVGRQVIAVGQALGMQVLVTDPFVASTEVPPGALAMPLDELLARADVVTLHVPLTTGGRAPTHHLLAGSRLAAGNWQLLINTSRGAVIDNMALLDLLQADPHRLAVLDVWEQEPVVPGELLDSVWIGTPHVAGYSSEGKWRGTEQVYRAACGVLGTAPKTRLADVLAAQGDSIMEIAWPGELAELLLQCCPVVADTERLRAAVDGSGVVPAGTFDAQRRDYPERREFSHYRVCIPAADACLSAGTAQTKTPQTTAALLRSLGFQTRDQAESD